MIRLRALQLFIEEPITDIMFHRFLLRRTLVFRRITTSGLKLSRNLRTIIENCFEKSQFNFMIPNFDLSNLTKID